MIRLCQNCGERPSSTVAKININGEQKDICLCTKCATKLGILKPEEHGYESLLFGRPNERYCEACGTKESEFLATGVLGCAKCAYVFDGVKNFVEKKCGAGKHCGKTSSSLVLSKTKVETLLLRLEEAKRTRNAVEIGRIREELRRLGQGNAKR